MFLCNFVTCRPLFSYFSYTLGFLVVANKYSLKACDKMALCRNRKICSSHYFNSNHSCGLFQLLVGYLFKYYQTTLKVLNRYVLKSIISMSMCSKGLELSAQSPWTSSFSFVLVEKDILSIRITLL